ncbi:hypothetical protein OSTOST_11995, partial [Ostertagia ostertagi]
MGDEEPMEVDQLEQRPARLLGDSDIAAIIAAMKVEQISTSALSSASSPSFVRKGYASQYEFNMSITHSLSQMIRNGMRKENEEILESTLTSIKIADKHPGVFSFLDSKKQAEAIKPSSPFLSEYLEKIQKEGEKVKKKRGSSPGPVSQPFRGRDSVWRPDSRSFSYAPRYKPYQQSAQPSYPYRVERYGYKSGFSPRTPHQKYGREKAERPRKVVIADPRGFIPSLLIKHLLPRGGFMTTFDLKSGFHHIRIAERSQRFLGFYWNNKYYKFTLPAPHIFTKSLAFDRIRKQAKEVAMYLDVPNFWRIIDEWERILKGDPEYLKGRMSNFETYAPESLLTASSTSRELFAIHFGLLTFGPVLSGTVLLRTDNQAACTIYKTGSILEHLQIQAESIWELENSLGLDRVIIEWIPREENVMADSESRELDFDSWGINCSTAWCPYWPSQAYTLILKPDGVNWANFVKDGILFPVGSKIFRPCPHSKVFSSEFSKL